MKIFISTLCLIFIVNMGIGQVNHTGSKHSQNMHKIIIEEVMQTNHYTYILMNEDDSLQWAAVPKMDAKKGDVYYYQGGMQMGQFKSKELNRTFDQILFLGEIKSEEEVQNKADKNSHVAEVKIKKENILIEEVEGTISVAELFENKDNYANKLVKIKGKVTKFSDSIMKRNWIHLQDGTNSHGNFDLTITTAETAKVGEVIVIEGKVILDKDFGYGYYYAVMIEDGKIIK